VTKAGFITLIRRKKMTEHVKASYNIAKEKEAENNTFSR
jgi:hypothetical protein